MSTLKKYWWVLALVGVGWLWLRSKQQPAPNGSVIANVGGIVGSTWSQLSANWVSLKADLGLA